MSIVTARRWSEGCHCCNTQSRLVRNEIRSMTPNGDSRDSITIIFPTTFLSLASAIWNFFCLLTLFAKLKQLRERIFEKNCVILKKLRPITETFRAEKRARKVYKGNTISFCLLPMQTLFFDKKKSTKLFIF